MFEGIGKGYSRFITLARCTDVDGPGGQIALVVARMSMTQEGQIAMVVARMWMTQEGQIAMVAAECE